MRGEADYWRERRMKSRGCYQAASRGGGAMTGLHAKHLHTHACTHTHIYIHAASSFAGACSPERVDDRVGRRRPTDASPEVQAKLALLTSPIAAPAAAPGSAGAAALGVKSTVPGIPAAPATEAALSARSLVPDQGHSHTSKSPTRSHRSGALG
eukprot:245216-Pelagomonas_calceolata.AAC.14